MIFPQVQNLEFSIKNSISEELELEQIIRQDGKKIEIRFESVDKIYDALVEILLGQLANPDLTEDDISLDSNFIEDLKADSLDLIEMVVSIEECFDVTVPDDLTFKIRTMQQALDIVLKLREAKGFVHSNNNEEE